MFLLDDVVVCSATDLTVAMGCEFATLRRLDEIRGLVEPLEVVDAVRDRAAALGIEHEDRVLEAYRRRYGSDVVEIEPVTEWTAAALLEQQHRTVAALRAGAPVVAQGGFFDGRLHGRPDFLLRADVDPDPASEVARGDAAPSAPTAYAVADAKLARWPRPTAVLQTAVYADQLLRTGIATTPHTHLLLGTGTVTSHDSGAATAVVGELRPHVLHLLDGHAATGEPVRWGAPGIRACGRCDACKAALEPARDLGLVWGMRRRQREALVAAGVTTLDELAGSTLTVPRIDPGHLVRLRRQAQLQLQQERAEAGGAPQTEAVVAEVHTLEVLDALPDPDPGDVFFDFEGDPFWTDGDRTERGLEYLFGILEAPQPDGVPRYLPLWAHDRAQEKQALVDFLEYLRQRRAEHPRMHVYHYAFYEPAALRTLAARHGTGEDEVEALLRDGVLVDLYEAVKRGVHVSQRSYSIKKLEPLYMGARTRDLDGVSTGGDSVLAYADARELRDAGDEAGWQERMTALAAYNRYDCESTLGLRDWLLARREEARHAALDAAVAGAAAALGGTLEAGEDRTPVAVGAPAAGADGASTGLRAPAIARSHGSPATPATETNLDGVPAAAPGPAPVRRLRDEEVLARRLLADPDLADDPAVPLLVAALDYHRREDEPFWQAHRDRLSAIGPRWHDDRDVMVVHRAEADDWEDPGSGRLRRRLVVEGRWGIASTVEAGAEVFSVYHPPLPFGMDPRAGQTRAAGYADVLEVGTTEAGEDRVVLRERLPADAQPHRMTPVLLTPGPPPSTRTLVAAIADVVRGVLGEPVGSAAAPAGAPGREAQVGRERLDGSEGETAPGAGPAVGRAALDLLRRRPPRHRALPGPATTTGGADPAAAVIDDVLASDDSYVAVQGPPGSGKTRLAADVVARLVTEHGWRVGVVAQSHAVIEHLLDHVVAAGVHPDRVGKRARGGGATEPWRRLDGTAVAEFLTQDGVVLGGTLWDFTNRHRVALGALDLLVVEEAGQFSLAATLAVSTATRRLLLLGDPQQLPQVSQGVHDAPVDLSALAWLADGADTLPPHLGHLLTTTWRLHPALCAAVSHLAYDDRLHSAAVAAGRHLAGIDPGVHVVPVEHEGNAVDSPEEAAEVVAQVERLLGEDWHDGATTRPLEQRDVLVVAAYNAQVNRVRHDLEAEGLDQVRVGTVDRFQGQQAAVVVVSLAASSADDAPRGLAFLLSRNRINVAISRAMWSAVVVRSPALTRAVPRDEESLVALGAFIRLCRAAHDRRPRHRDGARLTASRG